MHGGHVTVVVDSVVAASVVLAVVVLSVVFVGVTVVELSAEIKTASKSNPITHI